MSVLLFLLVIFILVLVHEFGHFIVAKKTGMRVDEFGIGFPPKVASTKKGETEYSLNLLPIGGFVKIFGEDALDAVDDNGKPVRHPDYQRSFIAKKPWEQAAVLVAGVSFNIMFAWLLFVLVIAMGVPTIVDESVASDAAQVVVSDVLPGSPADEAGLVRGAVLKEVVINGETIEVQNISQFQSLTDMAGESGMTVSYSSLGKEIETTLTPEKGVVETSPDTHAIGVALSMIDIVSEPIHIALWQGTVQTFNTLAAVTVGISELIADSVLLQADLSSVAGPVGIVGLVNEAAQFGLTSLMLFTALISINLAVINLLPFPALDGGRLLMVGIEKMKGSPIKPEWVMRINTVGFALLIALMVAVTWSDIAKMI